MTTGIDRNAYFEAWAKMMITIWQDKMIALNVRDTGELLQSFNYQLFVQSGGDIGKIIFTYNYYGRMVDMGVGRGQPKGAEGNYKAKDWYTTKFYRSIKVMNEKMAEMYGEEFKYIILETLN